MLKHRLIFGTLMIIAFVAIILFDGLLDGSLTPSVADNKPARAILFVILISLLMIPGLFELSKLAASKGTKILLPVTIPGAIAMASFFYWQRYAGIPGTITLPVLLAFLVMACFLYQRIRYGLSGVFSNCSAGCFSALYLGLLGGFTLAIRIDFGCLHLLMFVFVVKCADIGAYTAGRLWGKHKFAPVISPGKTWEGMAGAVVAAVAAAVAIGTGLDIMALWPAVIFGAAFAFIGQLGDLAESMIKRDAEKKDASGNVPGFGGVLDVVDSVLIAAPIGYLFFYVLAN